MAVPEVRIRKLNKKNPNPNGQWVLYWMTAHRRSTYNFALDRAIEVAAEQAKPLFILEAVRQDYPWACDRFHRFLIDGMIDNQKAFASTSVVYYPFLDTNERPGRGLIEYLASHACIVISDDFPCFFYPAMYGRLADRLQVSFELVDSNGIIPLRHSQRTFTVAHSYRRYMQKVWAESPPVFPAASPFQRKSLAPKPPLPKELLERWPRANLDTFVARSASLDRFAIDHAVAPTSLQGGSCHATKLLKRFIDDRLDDYDQDRNFPSKEGSSGLSPYLHFGHVSAHEVFERLMKKEGWSPKKLAVPNGKMDGFWNVSPSAEAFLDQLLTWREIGFNQCSREKNFDHYASLPEWAKLTLAEHASDPRPFLYRLEEWEMAETHDSLWNAAQRQLVREGVIHNYLRMLWGKKILHWSATPEEALATMIHLNNKYALDGRDPNSYSGIFWVLGRYDRAWGPERPVFGKVRYMTSDSTARKFPVKEYLHRFGADEV